MIKINVVKESNYSVNTSNIKKSLSNYLLEKKVKGKVAVDVSVVSLPTMKTLGKKYLKERGNKAHNVLSFTASETKEKFIETPENIKRLGEIVVCFPILEKEAREEKKDIDEKAVELVLHGAKHLMGIHHD